MSSSFFFLYCYRDHRDLHSFPTRRSSDLCFFAMEQAAQRGIKVRVLLDDLGSRSYPRYKDMLKRLTNAGIEWHLTLDRKSTRLNSSHVEISYAVFCLKKKKNYYNTPIY